MSTPQQHDLQLASLRTHIRYLHTVTSGKATLLQASDADAAVTNTTPEKTARVREEKQLQALKKKNQELRLRLEILEKARDVLVGVMRECDDEITVLEEEVGELKLRVVRGRFGSK